MSKATSSKSLHGDTSDRSSLTLLIIDAINDFAFPEGLDMLPSALSMAAFIRRLKSEARRFHIPTIYVNDNFGAAGHTVTRWIPTSKASLAIPRGDRC
jgi:nicotinamidase-related amidase